VQKGGRHASEQWQVSGSAVAVPHARNWRHHASAESRVRPAKEARVWGNVVWRAEKGLLVMLDPGMSREVPVSCSNADLHD
jgi:hypothetical protein